MGSRIWAAAGGLLLATAIGVIGATADSAAAVPATSPAAAARGATTAPALAAPAATWSQCRSRAATRRTYCLMQYQVAGNRCSASMAGVFTLTSAQSLITCKRSWGAVYTWSWA